MFNKLFPMLPKEPSTVLRSGASSIESAREGDRGRVTPENIPLSADTAPAGAGAGVDTERELAKVDKLDLGRVGTVIIP
jgi:hypothetical protein